MSAILKFDFRKRKQLRFSVQSKLSKLHKKRPNFACDNYVFPKTRGNKNKQWTHSPLLKESSQWVIPHKTLPSSYRRGWISWPFFDKIEPWVSSLSSTKIFVSLGFPDKIHTGTNNPAFFNKNKSVGISRKKMYSIKYSGIADFLYTK